MILEEYILRLENKTYELDNNPVVCAWGVERYFKCNAPVIHLALSLEMFPDARRVNLFKYHAHSKYYVNIEDGVAPSLYYTASNILNKIATDLQYIYVRIVPVTK